MAKAQADSVLQRSRELIGTDASREISDKQLLERLDGEADMIQQPNSSPSTPRKGILVPAILLTAALVACSVYANLSFTVKNTANYRFFPPFTRGVNANGNGHLGAEYFNIARSLAAGQGFANPFPEPTGPTAWMPPALPTLLAGLLWVADGDKNVVMSIVIFLQVYTLAATGFLVLALAQRTTGRLGACVAATLLVLGVLCNFRLWFQFTHDYWLILLAVDLLIAGLCWSQPLGSKKAAAAWGLFGGLAALISPIVALCWGGLSLWDALRQRAWVPFALAILFAGLALAPWTVRNYLVFDRLIPVKSNLAYELYQSQCLQPDGLLQGSTFKTHPIANATGSRREYKTLGEMAFLDRKREQFWTAVRADPADFIDRVASRLLGATLWYMPFDRTGEANRPWVLWLSRLTHPLPFLAVLVLMFTAIWQRLDAAQWFVIGVYFVYLAPYVAISYYDRYAVPLLGVKVLLVVWAADRLVSFWPPRRMKCEQKGLTVRSARTAKPKALIV